jgi:hypothetical protein
LAIPRLLGISWWGLLLLGVFEAIVRFYVVHWPAWIPSISGLWYFLQAGWLKVAEPKSRAIYFYIVSTVGDIFLAVIAGRVAHRKWIESPIDLALFAIWVTGLFVFRSEMKRHFTETDPRGIELSALMTFFFSLLYFQYWFHQIYMEQNEADLSLT